MPSGPRGPNTGWEDETTAEMRKTECISGLSGSMVLRKSHRGRIRGLVQF